MSQRIRSAFALYAAAMLQGLTIVNFAASGAVLKEMKGFTDAQYGLIFLPQIATTILGSIVGGGVARRIGLKNLLLLFLAGNALSQFCLGAIAYLPNAAALAAVLAGTAFVGLAYGLGAAPLNTMPALLFPERRDTALVALHSVMGMGFASGPVLVGVLIVHNRWVAAPALLLVACVALFMFTLASPLPRGETSAVPISGSGGGTLMSSTLWLFGMVAVLYAFAEGTFSNWAVIYLHEVRGIAATTAGLALSVFWVMVVVGRLLVSALLLRIPAASIWLTLPLLMAATFFIVPYAHSAVAGVALFGFAGLACSAFFPLTVSLAAKRFPRDAALVSSMMIAALMAGLGIGSFMLGAFRAVLSLEHLYQLSAIYPIAALLVALFLVRKPSTHGDAL